LGVFSIIVIIDDKTESTIYFSTMLNPSIKSIICTDKAILSICLINVSSKEGIVR